MTDQSSKQRRRTLVGAIMAIAATSDQWTRCWAQEVKDVHAGYELASKVCSPCHVVAPLPGPSFMDIAKSQYGSPAPLENFLRSTHSDVGHPGGMPNISLSREQIRTISAYIGSLREAR
jgi:mono/diheme cytochrome c family protein